jgi:glycosyltransferase involved in cell wall biosynthesis
MSEVKVSVIIPTLNSAEILGKCLDSVTANNGRYSYEIIVVDGGSTDQTVEIAQKYNAVVLKGFQHRINRNIGVLNATGDIICFTDSDCVVPEDWIDKLVDGLLRLNGSDSKIVGVGGGNIPWLRDNSLEELAIARVMHSPLVAFKARNTAEYRTEREVNHNPPLNSALFRWAIFEGGGFEEELGYGYCEDSALDAKLTDKGYKLYYLPGVHVYHRHPSNTQKFAEQMYSYGWGRVKLREKHKAYFRVYHWGPILLRLLTFSPFFFIPLGMAITNACYTSFKEKTFRLFLPLTQLTMIFYLSYSRGEIAALKERNR